MQAAGRIELGTPGEQIVIERADGEAWLEEARGPTDAAGSFLVDLPALRGGFYRARAEVSGAVSEPVLLEVLPRIRVTVARGRAFVGARLTARIWPTSYTGSVSIAVRDRGRVVAAAGAGVRDGGVLDGPLLRDGDLEDRPPARFQDAIISRIALRSSATCSRTWLQ